ncbi:hypothetical protein SODG_002076 [Sodalis praecaptivus]
MTSGSEEITRKTLSRQLKARRKELDYSLQTLAELSGVSISMISRTERGEVTPPLLCFPAWSTRWISVSLD